MSSTEEVRKLFVRSGVTVDARLDDRILADALVARAEGRKTRLILAPTGPITGKRMWWSRGGYLAAAFLLIASWLACFIAYSEITALKGQLESARRNIVPAPLEDSATINVYLTEHEEVVARRASLDTATSGPLRMRVSPQDLLYYETYDHPEFVRPGIIVRGPSSPQDIGPSESPTIANGHMLTLSEARAAVGFHLVSPSWLHPCYKLDQIRKIKDRDALQLLYTNGINSVSLFEQPVDGQRGLQPRDFREYVVYRNQGRIGGAILTWRDDARLYVLIGNAEVSQLMDIAQSVNAAK